MSIYFYYLSLPFTYITLAANENSIKELSFGKHFHENAVYQKTKLITSAEAQLTEYLEGKRKYFDLPIAPEGTDFQKKVWERLMQIPYGKTKSYGQIAAETGNPKASRAVGNANNKNPIAIIIPCHRVIGKNGKLTGYAGGLDIKKTLLNLESKYFI